MLWDIVVVALTHAQQKKRLMYIAQAEALKKMLAERGQEVSVMLDLDVPEEELMTRLIKRGQESGRADDNEETIKKRLVVYHSQTDVYKRQSLLRRAVRRVRQDAYPGGPAARQPPAP